MLDTDPIIAIPEWPSLSAQYLFEKVGSQSQIQIDFLFDPSPYTVSATITNPGALKKAQMVCFENADSAAAIYGKISAQLRQEDVKITFRSSINRTHDKPQGTEYSLDKESLSHHVNQIVRYLQAIIENNGDATKVTHQIPTLSFTQAVTAVNPQYIYELTVNLTIARTAHVDPDFPDGDRAARVTRHLKPLISESPNPTKNDTNHLPYTLEGFARKFEAAFIDIPQSSVRFKIATSIDKDDGGSQTNKKRIWVVRFDKIGEDGIRCDINKNQPYFFAPPPLAVRLKSYQDVPISAYDSDKAYPASNSPTSKSYVNIDLDAWGKQCLEAIDEFLSPEYAVPAFIVDETMLNRVQQAKHQIATAIANSITNILQTDEPDFSDLSSAQETCKQRLLIHLANAYKIDAIVQHPVSVNYKFISLENEQPPSFTPHLFGKMIAAGTNATPEKGETLATEYSLSSAKIPLAESGKSWLTYLFDAKEAANHRSYKFDEMSYQITRIEHQIGDVPAPSGGVALSWLTFVIPLPIAKIGSVEIPIPLRAYPNLPSITAQESDYKYDNPETAVSEITIHAAKQWGYAYTYKPGEAAQDHITTQIQFNCDPATYNHEESKDDKDNATGLAAALAQFVAVYPQIRNDFVNALAKVNPTTSHTDPTFTKARHAMQSFSTIITAVADGWRTWHEAVDPPPADDPANIHRYEIFETAVSANAPHAKLQITIHDVGDNNASIPVPYISIPGYTTKSPPPYTFYKQEDENNFLTYENRNSAQSRTISLDGLSIMEKQNAWASVQLTHNKNLIEITAGRYQQTNPKFVYQTPLVRFYNPQIPLLDCRNDIDIACINPGNPNELTPAPQKRPLNQHLHNLFAAIFHDTRETSQTIKVECAYQYNLGGTAVYTQIPILLAPPFEFNVKTDNDIGQTPADCAPDGNNAQNFVCHLTHTITDWYRTNTPGTQNDTILFKIDVYSNNNPKMPLLKLHKLTLKIDDIQPQL